MNREILKRIVFDQHEIIRNAHIVPRRYTLDPQANYVVTGLRRAGKSTILYGVVRTLVQNGVEWERIIYINFEDERLADFTSADFQDILLTQGELSDKSGYFSLMKYKSFRTGKSSPAVSPTPGNASISQEATPPCSAARSPRLWAAGTSPYM